MPYVIRVMQHCQAHDIAQGHTAHFTLNLLDSWLQEIVQQFTAFLTPGSERPLMVRWVVGSIPHGGYINFSISCSRIGVTKAVLCAILPV